MPTGRDAERDVVATFVAAAAEGRAALHLEGEPGIGKTTLFHYAIDLATAAGSIVLECSPTTAEQAMSFVALTDLLRPLAASWFEEMPTPQRHSLEVATLRAAPSSDPVDERAVGTGLTTLVDQIAAVTPIVIAIDDAQWLDQSSRDVITFAARRLASASVGVLTCARTGEAPVELVDALPLPRWQRTVTLAGLGSAALFHIVRDRLDVTLARPALTRVTATSGGNPFAAIELARRFGEPTSGGDEHVAAGSGTRSGTWLQTLTSARLVGLSGAARTALLAAASSPQPTVALLTALDLAPALDEAESDGAVSLLDGRIVFAHPLLAAAVVDAATAPECRAMHARLADVTSDPEARARHRALASTGRDEATAVALDEATTFAEARGSSIAAAELARLALDHTDDREGPRAWERRIRLAELLHAAGASVEAGATLERLDSCPEGVLRARGLLILTEVAYQTSSTQEAVDHATAARVQARGHPAIEARCLLSMAVLATDGRVRARHAAEATALLAAAQIDDVQLVAWAACEEISARFGLGEGLDIEGLEHALVVERTARTWRSSDQVAAVRPVLLKWGDRPVEALAALIELETRAEEEGNEGVIPYVLGHVPGILLRLGRFADAADAAAEHLAHAERTGQESQRMQALYNVALADAHLGRLDAARATAMSILAWAVAHDDQWLEMSATSTLGFVETSAGDAPAARRWLDRWAQLCDALAIVDPGISRFHGDHIEALVACGSIDEAAHATLTLEARAERSGRTTAAAVAARCRALLAASTGDVATAFAHLDRSLRFDETSPVAFERHRTTMLRGLIHRRGKEKAAARRELTAAAAGFAALGASSWTQRCERELERIGTRVSTSLALTATEQRIADLAATGLTTRQMAEQCFISPKTVETNLGRIYRKLGVSSRAELGARLRG